MFKASSDFFTDRSKAEFLLRILFVIYVSCFCLCYLSCLFLKALWSPTGKRLFALLCVVFYCVFFSLSHIMSRVRSGTQLYQFFIVAFPFTFIMKFMISMHTYPPVRSYPSTFSSNKLSSMNQDFNKECVTKIYFAYFSTKTYGVGI